jgi:hypothetical protein
MAGLVPAIHVLDFAVFKTWMPATSAGMTTRKARPLFVMAGHSRSKNGVLSHAYVPAIHVFADGWPQDVDAQPGMTPEGRLVKTPGLRVE